MAIINIASKTNTSNVTSDSVTYGATPTSGRILVAGIAWTNAITSPVTPSGWTPLNSTLTGNVRCATYHKVSAGTEGTVSFSWTTSSRCSLFACELDDTAANVLDASAENEANISTIVTSQPSGTANTTKTSGRAVAIFAAQGGAKVDAGRAYTNSFVENLYQFGAGSAAAGIGIASKAISASGNYETTFSTTDTGDEMYGVMALFTPSGTTVFQKIVGHPFALAGACGLAG